MTNPKPLQQLLLRQMLLEGSSSDAVTRSMRRFNKSKQTPQDRTELVNAVRKEITKQSKTLMSEDTISDFINDTAPFVNNESVLD